MNTPDTPIKICLFSGDITRTGGTERVASFLANELCSSPRFDVSIVSITEASQTPFYNISPTIPRFTLSDRWLAPGPGYVGVILKLLRIIYRQKWDVIIDIDTVLDYLTIPCRFLSGITIISWEHFFYHETLGTCYRTFSRKLSCMFSNQIVTLTEQDTDAWKTYGKPRCPVTCIPNPFNIFPPYAPPEHRNKIILSAGRLVPEKGFEDIIHVARLVIPKHPDWKFVIVGDGPDREQLLTLIKKYHLEKHIILPGYVSNMPDYYLGSSIYLLTSKSEGLPMVLLEAKYYRLPCISYQIPTGPSEIILDNINGYLTPKSNIAVLAEKLCFLIENDDLRSSFSKHAWDNACKFDKKTFLNQWTELLLCLYTKK